MTRRVSLIARIAGVLTPCPIMVCCGGNDQPGDTDYPQENPSPTKFLSIRGTINTSLDIDFRISWYAKNLKYQDAISRIAGAYSPYGAWSALVTARQGAQFSARVPIDGVLPDRCQWRFGGVTYGAHTGYRTALNATNSYPLKSGRSPNGTAEPDCKWVSINRPGFTIHTWIVDGPSTKILTRRCLAEHFGGMPRRLSWRCTSSPTNSQCVRAGRLPCTGKPLVSNQGLGRSTYQRYSFGPAWQFSRHVHAFQSCYDLAPLIELISTAK
jgi:hypothetical protein